MRELDAYHLYEQNWDSYEQLCEEWQWDIPDQFNIASYVCDRWAEHEVRTALVTESSDGVRREVTYQDLQADANRLANFLSSQGVTVGDRVAYTGVQKRETLVAAIAIFKLGGVAVPVSNMFGTEGLEYRLADCDVAALVTDRSNVDTVRKISDDLPQLETLITVDVDEGAPGETAFSDAIAEQSADFETVVTTAEDPSIIFYTSGTTGDPKGTLHTHRSFLGNLPALIFTHLNMELQDEEFLWLLTEWSWLGFYIYILGGLFFGKRVFGFARDESFDPTTALEIVERNQLTFCRFSPTAIRMMMRDDAWTNLDLTSVRSITLGGEKVSEQVFAWVREAFPNASVSTAFGQTEAPVIAGQCEFFGKVKRDSLGVPMPGQEIEILNPDSLEPLPTGDIGEIAVRYEDNPICFLEYWNQPEKTAQKVQDGWLLTEDLGHIDEEGYLWYQSRKDDVIISSGYRIGPEEIEDTLADHEAVIDVGVIGVPHETRGEVPKAFVRLADGTAPADDLKDELEAHVKDRLAKYEYPREIEVVEDLPTTSTGKLRRVALREREGIGD